ncbi:MAG: NAD(P)-binding protein, partial [Acetobacteraceae bacterium]|nr:NAD(P)-binding protein [Acetobacteraceae bacterium]
MTRKIAIVGGGMAGLTAAYELTRTPELQQNHEVTVYQLGWRLG